MNNYRLVLRRSHTRYVGVWEIASHNRHDTLALLFRGFHPFATFEYNALGAREFLLQSDRALTQELERQDQPSGKAISVMKIFETAKLAPDERKTLDLEGIEGLHPDMRELVASGELEKILENSSQIAGQHFYVYQQSPRTLQLIERLKSTPNVAPEAFEPIVLPEEQIKDFNMVASKRFRMPQEVKVIKLDNGELFMLNFFPKFYWIKPSRENVVGLWQFGPAIEGRRILICRGLYSVDRNSYGQLTSESVSGLQDSVFQYNNAELP